MDVLDDFSLWMRKNSSLSDSSVQKYKGGLRTVSREMQELGIISKPLADMNLLELDIAIFNILNNDNFLKKNKTGNNMYSNSLKQFRYFRLDASENYDVQSEILREINDSSLGKTEKDALVKARVGQGEYRNHLIEKYDGRCLMTGIDNKKLLIASHIKPWSVCNNEERLDINNGLLLCANMDRLFDSGLTTFKSNGALLISSFVGKENENRLHIKPKEVYDLKSTSKMQKYLEYHRDTLFVK